MAVLTDPRFRRLLVGQSLSSFGDSALYLTLAIWAKELTGSNAAAGAVFFALGLPVLTAPVAGHLADRVGRRRLLVVTNAVAGVGVLSLLAVDSRTQVWIIYAVAVGYGAASTLLRAGQSGLLKDLLAGDDLGSANAWFQSIQQGLRLASPLVGAALYARYGGEAVALLDTATFVVAVTALLGIKVEESQREHDPQPLLAELTAGIRHVRRTPVLARIALVAAIAFGVIGFFESVDFAVIDQGLHRPPSFFGVLSSVQGAGSILGGLTVSLLLRRLGEARTVGIALLVLGDGALALTQQHLPAVLAGVAVMGVGIPWLLVGYLTAAQRLTPPRLQGRVAGTTQLLTSGPQTASIAIGAGLITVLDYRILLLIISAVLIGCGALLTVQRTQQERSSTTDACQAGAADGS